ncbi:MAG TPA: hypothetical protein VF111_13390 [Thermoanaerobaculia bacterium]
MISGRTGSFKLPALLALLIALPLTAGGVYELRSRWNAKTYDVTQIARLGESRDRSAFLVTHGNDRYVILDVSDYANQKVTRMVRNVATGDYVQMSYTYRSSTTTRSEFMAEARLRQNEQIDQMLYQTNRGQLVTREAQLRSPETRKALNAILTPQFGLDLQRLQSELLAHTNLRVVCNTVVMPITGAQCERSSAPVLRGAKPDCDVDAAFGFPCSASQRSRSTKAPVHVSTATRY